MMKYLLYPIFPLLMFASCSNGVKYFDVGELPQDWIALTETDSGMVIFNPCDHINEEIRLIETDSVTLLQHLEGHEATMGKIVHTYKTPEDTIMLDVDWIDWDKSAVYKFTWIDQSKGIAEWVAIYNNREYYSTMVIKEHEMEYPTVEQPCIECWGDECELWDRDDAIEDIRKVYEDYMESGEKTDHRADKELILEALKKVEIALEPEQYKVILNVWMYYDPADFDFEGNIERILMIDPAKGAAAILTRMADKEKWESLDHPPLSELNKLRLKIWDE